MQVIIKENDTSFNLKDLSPGVCFKIKGSMSRDRFIRARTDATAHLKWRTVSDEVDRIPAVNLETGEIKCFMSNVKVYMVKSQVVCDD